MEYKIAIPTYMRVDVLQEKTLSYLKQTNVNFNNIYIFVANQKEYEEYSLLNLKNVIIGKETIKAQRNFIRNYFDEGEYIFSIDDDIEGIYTTESIKKFKLVTDLNSLIIQGFTLCNKLNTKLFGVSAVKNSLFIHDKKVSGNLRYIVGAAFGQIIDKDVTLNQTLDDKGDYERSIKYFIKFGSVIRINNVAVSTSYYKKKGGMQIERTKERVKQSGLYLINKYPQYCRENTKKKNKEFYEIELRYDSKRNNIKR